MIDRGLFGIALGCSLLCVHGTVGADEPALTAAFEKSVQPFLKSYCLSCHGLEKQEAKLDLSGATSVAAVVQQHQIWNEVLTRLTAKDMPPETSTKQPTEQERSAIIAWIKALQQHEAERNAGDPGPVLARRLSHAEYNNAIRDLTGFDLRPTQEFPVDPANEAGFDNSGESLTMSPALLKKYLAAARRVAEHLAFQPDGLSFAPHPMISETDRDKFCVQRIVAFYERHRVDLADYFEAAAHFRQHQGKPGVTLETVATARQLSPKYLTTIWTALNTAEALDPLAELQAEWQTILVEPEPTAVRQRCEKLRDLVLRRRQKLVVPVEKLHMKGNSDGSQPLVLWWNREQAAQRMRSAAKSDSPELDAARNRFCRVFPDAFAVSSRGHYADAKLGAQVRLLTAGFHLMQGYFRDDAPLCELVLSDTQRQEIDRLWQELNFITLAPHRQYKDFLFFERAEPPRFAGGPEFDFARPEDKSVTTAAMLNRMKDAYLAKSKRMGASDAILGAVETYFDQMLADTRWIEQRQVAAGPIHLDAVLALAERAYRRPLSDDERQDLRAFYHQARDQERLSHEDAIRDTLATILLSPHFCYRFDQAAEGTAARPLTDYELASRLSFFLWSSLPDAELLKLAAAEQLHEPSVLAAQAHRMLRDARVRGLASEFLGNWLGFRRFEDHTGVDRDRFATFTNELRDAMAEEPQRFFIDLVQRDGSMFDLLEAHHTFVNPVLARHYGMTIPATRSEEWVRVDNAAHYGRGGILPMAVFLTKNSPGLRTSPVQRGYWVVRRVLGEHIPPPPPTVPELPKDEAELGELTLPQLLARHRDHVACAACHQRFDSIGLVFEGYGPIGEQRKHDLGGKPVHVQAVFPDGTERSGLNGLRRYLTEVRRDEYVETLCRKLLTFALGRSLLLSDNATIELMQTNLRRDENRIGSLVETIVTSPQFLKKRGRDDPRP